MTNDMKLPARMIYGTAWKKERTTGLVVAAVRAGFRAVDTAAQLKHYNQAGTGEALRILAEEDGLKREDLFLQTKFTSLDGQDRNGPLPYDPNAPLAEQVRQSFKTSLSQLQTDYIDSVLLHSPERTVAKTCEALLALKPFLSEGTLKYVGISNIYSYEALAAVAEVLAKEDMRLSFIQNRFYADTGYDQEIRQFCKTNDIAYQSFWTLTANPSILSSRAVRTAANRLQATPEQVFYSFCIGEGIVPLNGTTNEDRMKLGVQVMNGRIGQLSTAEASAIRKMLQ